MHDELQEYFWWNAWLWAWEQIGKSAEEWARLYAPFIPSGRREAAVIASAPDEAVLEISGRQGTTPT